MPTSATMPARRAGDLRRASARAARMKLGPQEQILGRVAGDRQLGEEDEVGARAARLLEPREDPLAVAVEIADDGVDLGERESHCAQSRFSTLESKTSSAWSMPKRDPRYPRAPEIGNGGYTCGLVAAFVDGPDRGHAAAAARRSTVRSRSCATTTSVRVLARAAAAWPRGSRWRGARSADPPSSTRPRPRPAAGVDLTAVAGLLRLRSWSRC